jgi:hypothetical protein
VNYAEYSDPEDTFFEPKPRMPRGKKTIVNDDASNMGALTTARSPVAAATNRLADALQNLRQV